LKACIEDADDDAAFIAKALGEIAQAKITHVAKESGHSTRPCQESVVRILTPS
jgi:DNA-binding phage protein